MTISLGYSEDDIIETIGNALEEFYSSLLDKINKLNMLTVMGKKNPYLYRAKAMQSASDIVTSVLDAYISSSEETIFGNCFFEPLALAASGGKKALAEGIDIQVEHAADHEVYAIAVKSGPSVFNADSKRRQEQNFTRGAKLASQQHLAYHPIIGYGYGKKDTRLKSGGKLYVELAGEAFWSELTGDPDFYKKIITYMGTLPEKYVELYREAYSKASNRLIRDFSNEFCDEDGQINWDKLVEFNSGSRKRQAQD